MCITGTVGNGGANAATDIRCVQLLLNMNRSRDDLSADLAIDGLWGAQSRTALAKFRSGIGVDPEALLVPGDVTMEAFRRLLPAGLTRGKLWTVMTDAEAARIELFFQPIITTLTRYAIDTPLRMAHFLAQIGHESGCLRYTKELDSGRAYEGRQDLGNVKKDDGPLFKGRGLIQLTGRNNYRAYGKACGRDLESDPNLVSTDPYLAADVAGWFWAGHQLNDWADRDDLSEITRRINGGLNGLADRAELLARAKWLLLP
ncbi:MAG TPA: glycoside hydrolase family 19 protein [Terriglobia bacterium]|nr:glycoside hydrolase family 19 protein [Terriglobia bacterium]